MKSFFLKISFFVFLSLVISCSSDDTEAPKEFVVAFSNPSTSFTVAETEKPINIVFSTMATETGTLDITYTVDNASYGSGNDFTTVPSGETGTLTIPIVSGTEGTSFSFNKLKNAIEGAAKSVSFTISKISITDAIIQGNKQTLVSFTESEALGGSFSPEVGGPHQPNQVYVDLSSQLQESIKRDSWDFGFYNGTEFRVVINGSLFMAAAQLESTDIDAVTESSVADLQPKVAVGTFDPSNMAYVDNTDGDLSKTAIAEITDEDSNNKVYLVNLGYKIGTKPPNVGSIALKGDARGWKKIRVLKRGADYLIQYADLESTTHEEITISKKEDYDFTFLSLESKEVANLQPKSKKWDLNFTVFTNEFPGAGSYGYSDFITTNHLNGVQAYMVETATKSYTDFVKADIDQALFISGQRAIGSSWRKGGGPGSLPAIKNDIFYVLKDTEGNLYKINFTALVSEGGLRGNPAFEYELL